MNMQTLVALVLGSGVVIAVARLVMRAPASALRQRMALLALQPILAILLYFTLFPPPVERQHERLVLATAGTTSAQLAAHRKESFVLALPEAPALAGVERVPDLGTALRQHPEASRLLVLGAGLVARDRDVAAGHALDFEAAPLPRGLVALWSPTDVTVGARWQASGRVHAVPGGKVELLDPAGRRRDLAKLAADGQFTLHGSAPVTGRALFKLRVRDARGQSVEAVELPLQIVPGVALRVLMLAGGPSPELKYLRRWALDTGASMRTQITLGGGLSIGDPPLAIDATTLRDFDLVVLDERAWRELGSSRKSALRDALRVGLGVLLRVTGPLSPIDRRELVELGFGIDSANLTQTITLPATTTVLSRQPLKVVATDAVALVRDDEGAALALWRSVGQGRMAIWWLGDSHRLVLAGESTAHGQLWSAAFTTLSRTRGARLPKLASADPRLHQRLVLCGLSEGASVVTESGESTPLLLDTAPNADRCATYWPGSIGWHTLRSGNASIAFHVRAETDAPGLLAQASHDATEKLAATASSAAKPTEIAVPGPRWPWFLGWLLVSALAWWLERRCLRGARVERGA